METDPAAPGVVSATLAAPGEVPQPPYLPPPRPVSCPQSLLPPARPPRVTRLPDPLVGSRRADPGGCSTSHGLREKRRAQLMT